MKELYIIRGLPGTGKTTLAQKLTPNTYFEADQYFMNANGEYVFNREHLADAHSYCQKLVEHVMKNTGENISVSNTFVKYWEFKPYRAMADRYGYRVTEITLTGPRYPNVHGVPDDVIERMRENWEK